MNSCPCAPTPLRTTARITAFSPGQSPPPVNTPMRIAVSLGIVDADSEYDAVTAAQQRTWSDGDFSMVASLVINPSETLTEALQILPDERVLDVACGSGNGAIAAARRAWGNTAGCAFVPAPLQGARERAAAERLDIDFVEGEAQALPF